MRLNGFEPADTCENVGRQSQIQALMRYVLSLSATSITENRPW